MYAFKHIVLTSDLSENSEAALPFAIALAKQSDGTIHLFHAFENETSEALRAGILVGASAWLSSVRKQRERDLIAIVSSIQTTHGVKATLTCTHGHPAEESVKFAKNINANLIVLSTHGRTGLPHLFLGSTAEKIARLSSVPVLTVRPGESVPSGREFRSILVATDFSKNAEAAIPFAVTLAKQGRAKIILTHVVENSAYLNEPTWSEGVGPDVEQWTQTLKAEGEKKLAAAAATLATQNSISVETVLKIGRPDEEICAAAKQYDADLIVMATHGYTGISHLAFGSVAEHVLRSSTVPVLSIRSIVS